MRPQKADMIINKAFRTFYKIPLDLDLHQALGVFRKKEVMKALDKCIEIQLKEYSEILKQCGIDPVSYVYYSEELHNKHYVAAQLHYISDRWRCIGRLNFLKKVIDMYS
jgi:hypothetical protein